jgi:hypothetical protein
VATAFDPATATRSPWWELRARLHRHAGVSAQRTAKGLTLFASDSAGAVWAIEWRDETDVDERRAMNA